MTYGEYEDDLALAVAIRAAVRALNTATRKAFEAKLRVDVQVQPLQRVDDLFPWPIVSIRIAREI